MNREAMLQKLVKGIIERMDKNEIPWKRPWKGSRVCRNYNSKREYSGINRLILPDGEFMTFYQAKKNGYQVKKGAVGFPISVPKEVNRKKIVEEVDEKGNKKEKIKIQKFFSFSIATVFHIDDIDGAETKIKDDEFEIINWDPVEHAEEAIRKGTETLDVEVNIRRSDRAFYVPAMHKVVVPEKTQYNEPADYYRVLLHELGHSTGHESLLNRELNSSVMMSQSYAKEELVAEIFSYNLLEEYGLSTKESEEQQIAYLKGWREKISSDPEILIKAASEAEKAMKLFSHE